MSPMCSIQTIPSVVISTYIAPKTRTLVQDQSSFQKVMSIEGRESIKTPKLDDTDSRYVSAPRFEEPSIFEDAIDRYLAGTPVRQEFAGGRYSTRGMAYVHRFAYQTNWRVPKEIVQKVLIPYMQDRMIFMRIEGSENEGMYLSVSDKGVVSYVSQVPGHTNLLKQYNPIKCWVLYHSRMTNIADEEDAPKGCEFTIPRGATAKEIIHRFWITIFGRVFQCGWQHFYSFIV